MANRAGVAVGIVVLFCAFLSEAHAQWQVRHADLAKIFSDSGDNRGDGDDSVAPPTERSGRSMSHQRIAASLLSAPQVEENPFDAMVLGVPGDNSPPRQNRYSTVRRRHYVPPPVLSYDQEASLTEGRRILAAYGKTPNASAFMGALKPHLKVYKTIVAIDPGKVASGDPERTKKFQSDRADAETLLRAYAELARQDTSRPRSGDDRVLSEGRAILAEYERLRRTSRTLRDQQVTLTQLKAAMEPKREVLERLSAEGQTSSKAAADVLAAYKKAIAPLVLIDDHLLPSSLRKDHAASKAFDQTELSSSSVPGLMRALADAWSRLVVPSSSF